jgi:hypothetical protein
MQALKALVIIMGVLIFAGMGLLVYGLMTRVTQDDEVSQVSADHRPAPQAFGDVEYNLPAGASVAGVSVDNGRAVVHVRLPGGGAEIRVFDLATGAVKGRIRLKGTP